MDKNKKSKIWLVFFGLKALELIGLIVATVGIYWVGRFLHTLLGVEEKGIWIGFWFLGMFGLLLSCVVLFLLGYIIMAIIQGNWNWAKKIVNGRKKRRIRVSSNKSYRR